MSGRVRKEYGEIGELDFAAKGVLLLTGEAAQESFFGSSEEQLDQGADYLFMTPVFGSGVVFHAKSEHRGQAMKTRSLKASTMRPHGRSIAGETRK